jgi:ribonuclease P protein component
MRREQRLRHRRDFEALSRQGRSLSGPLLAIRTRRNGLDESRFGFAVGKRVGKAVVRNRVKRRLRAAVGQLGPAGGWDVLISARAPAAAVGYDELVRALADLLVRARVSKKD